MHVIPHLDEKLLYSIGVGGVRHRMPLNCHQALPTARSVTIFPATFHDTDNDHSYQSFREK